MIGKRDTRKWESVLERIASMQVPSIATEAGNDESRMRESDRDEA